MPDVQFIFFGNNRPQEIGNVKFVGWLPIQEVIDQCSALIRITSHDGLPISPIEFILSGRPVITNVPMKYAEIVPIKEFNEDEYAMGRELIIQKLRGFEKNGYNKNDLAINYYKDILDPQKFKDRMYAFLREGK